MAVAAEVCIGAHLRVGLSKYHFKGASLNVRASCAKSSPCTKAYIPLSSLMP